jgi:hypothetical protein
MGNLQIEIKKKIYDKVYKQIYNAIEDNDVYAIKQILKKNKYIDLNLQYYVYGYDTYTYPLVTASIWRHTHIQIIRALLKKGADPNIRDSNGYTPLRQSVMWHNKKATRVLLEAGADPNIGDNYGFTPLMHASEFNIYYLQRALLEAGADTNIKTYEGRHSAMSYAQGKSESILIKYIMLVPLFHKKFKEVNKDIIRSLIEYI